uniref:DNA-directed RNA polymerases I, II, and III subunit RPABC1 n=1 Tax=Hemiselmis tepida TaxID=464990 RepID=A0A7S0V2R5_9CRYP|mmetsp:Transcript_11401/g.29634  ORF Transcript_11401/g.29634 Transcript_11401/m.29634 type:complete len:217 (+) Transcript_11401:40-690(+)
MEAEDKEILNLFKIRRTILQMLRDRSYVVFETQDDLEMSRSTFEQKFVKNFQVIRSELEINRSKWLEENMRILVVFIEGEKEKSAIGVKSIRSFCERIKQDGFQNSIIVLHGKLTSHAKQAINSINSIDDKIEYFSEAELIVNITEHNLVPKHEIISEEEARNLFKRYSIRENQLPRINKRDPISRYFGLQKNKIMKIIRSSETSGRYVTYRRCTG